MPHPAVPARLPDIRPPDIVDLGALLRDQGVVIEGRIVEPRPWRSPLDGGGHALTGGVVTDPVELDAIRARVIYGALPWHRRIRLPRPAGW